VKRDDVSYEERAAIDGDLMRQGLCRKCTKPRGTDPACVECREDWEEDAVLVL
jgi:hypothetical protein